MAGARRAILATCALALVAAAPTAHAQGPIPLPPLPPGPPGGGQQPPSKPPPPPLGAANPADFATSLWVGPRRDSYSPDDDLASPLRRLWSQRLGKTDYALVAQGEVFALVGVAHSQQPATLFALDLATGAVRWRQAAPYGSIAYEAGRVFVASSGQVAAFAADTGQPRWQATIEQPTGLLATPPAASRGVLYVVNERTLAALNESDGTTRWKVSVNENAGYVAAEGDAVYLGWGCGNVDSYSADGGQRRWHWSGYCSGGDLPVFHGNRIYDEGNGGSVLDAASGAQVGSLSFHSPPVFAGDTFVTIESDGSLAARRLDGTQVWRARAPARWNDQETPSTAPLAVGSTIYRVAGGSLYAYAAETGELLYVDDLPLQEDAVQANYEDQWANAGQGVLVVPAGDSLLAYSSALNPPAGGIATLPFEPDLPLNGLLILDGRLGHDLRAGGKRAVRAQVDRFPFGNWSQAADGTTRADGTFTFSGHVNRNTRLRVILPGTGVASPPAEFFVYPKVAFHARAVGRRVIAVRMGFTVARDTHLGGRRAFVYLDRVKRHRLERLGSGRVRGRRGRFSAAATVRLPGHLGAKDRFAYCIPHLSRAGLGRADGIDRRCGRRTLRG